MRTPFSNIGTTVLLVALGCAHAPLTPESPSTPPPAPHEAPGFGGAERGASSTNVAPTAPGALDPRETITPRELASIPDPVPAGESASAESRGPTPAAPSDSNSVIDSRTAVGQERGWIWRVQIFASPDPAQAGRIAKEASGRFGEPSVIEFEGTLYKVRLGAFTSEGLAQALREKAVQGGFPGAFRMRSETK